MKKMTALLFAALLSGAMSLPAFAASHTWNNTNHAQTTQKKKKKPSKKKKAPAPPPAMYR